MVLHLVIGVILVPPVPVVNQESLVQLELQVALAKLATVVYRVITAELDKMEALVDQAKPATVETMVLTDIQA